MVQNAEHGFFMAILGLLVLSRIKKKTGKNYKKNCSQVIFIHLKLWICGSRTTASNE